MSDKHRERIIDAAAQAFIRYGYRRVTMAALAEAAGLSRPTLYAAFPSKEAVFRAVAKQMMERSLAEIRECVAGPGSLAEKLEQVFEIWVVRTYELIHRAPDAKELVECTQAFSHDVIENAYAGLEAELVSIIEPHAGRGVPPRHLAHTLAVSARGIKEHARDVRDLRHLLAGLIEMAVVTLSASESATV